MVRPPFMVWVAALALLGAGLLTLLASGYEAWTAGEDGSIFPWLVLGVACLGEILMAMVVPMAQRWTTALSLLVSLAVGVLAFGLALTVGDGLVSLPAVASVASFFAAFLCLPTLALVHVYQNELEDLF